MKTKKTLFLITLVAIILGGCSYDSYTLDSDHDETPDHEDGCKYDKLKVAPGICGCGYIDDINTETQEISCRGLGLLDSDGDSVPDIYDLCPQNRELSEPSKECGCDHKDYHSTTGEGFVCVPYVDSDHDGITDDLDECPVDPWKNEPGKCGCGKIDYLNASTNTIQCVPAIDSDSDKTPDIYDGCPTNPLKKDPGICGCDQMDNINENGVVACIVIEDKCPDNPDKRDPGFCGCGVPDIDQYPRNGIPDCLEGNEEGENEENDADSDGIKNEDDACPFNPSIQSEEQITSNEYGCSYYVNAETNQETFVIEGSEDINRLREFLTKRMEESMGAEAEAPVPRDEIVTLDEIKKKRLTIKLVNDINLDVSTVTDEWGDVTNTWEPFPPTFNIQIVGAKDNMDLPIRITATNNGERVPLGGPLFLLLDYSEVSNIILDFDVESPMAAALAGGLNMTSLDRVVFSGSIIKTSDYNDWFEKHIEPYITSFYGELIGVYFDSMGGITTTIANDLINTDIFNYYMTHTDEVFTTHIENTFCSHAELYIASGDENGEDGMGSTGCIAGTVRGNMEYVFTDDTLKNTVDVLYSEASNGAVGGLFGSIGDQAKNVVIKNVKNEIDHTSVFSRFGGVIGRIDSYYYGEGELPKVILENLVNKTNVVTCDYDYRWVEDEISYINEVWLDSLYDVGCGGLIGFIETNSDVRLHQIYNNMEDLDCQFLCGGFIGKYNIGAHSRLTITDSENHIDNLSALKFSGGLIGALKYVESYDAGEGEFQAKNIYNQVDAYTFSNDIWNGDEYNGTLYGYYEGSYGYFNRISHSNIFSISGITSPVVYLFGNFVRNIYDNYEFNNIFYYKPNDGYHIETMVDDSGDYEERRENIKPYDGSSVNTLVSALNASSDTVQWKEDSTSIGGVSILVPKFSAVSN